MNNEEIIREQNWDEIEDQYFESEPYNYVVIDDFLSPDVCKHVRQVIVNNKGWWQSEELFIQNFEMSVAEKTAKISIECMPKIFKDLSLVQQIAFMYQRNAGLGVHADTGQVTLNIWLTPDEFNLEPDSGGLLLYDVKRTPEQNIHEFNARPWCVDYFNKNTQGDSIKIGYKFNRAIIFDAKTFHASDRINFVRNGAQTYRISYGLLFDNSEEWRNRWKRY